MKTKKDLAVVQEELHQNPHNSELATKEKEVANAYRAAWKDYNSFLHKKAKLHWLHEGDENSKVFFSSIKARKQQNTINII